MKFFNYDALAAKSWDREILGYIAQIYEHKGRQQLYLKQNPEVLDKLIEVAKIQSTESSNAIEGIVTTNSRLKQLMSEKTTPRNRDEKEILGYRRALDMIHESFEYMPVSANVILQLHKELYAFSESSFGGNFKDTPNTIEEVRSDGTRHIRFQPLQPWETPEAVQSICDNYNRIIKTGEVDPLVVIPTFIHDFLCIHPFNDGNGRMSRLLTTLLLYKSGFYVGKYVSLEKKISETKPDYYDALQSASAGWYEGTNDDTAFVKYLLGVTLSAYRDFESRVSIVAEKKSSKEMVEGAIYEKLGKITKSDIMEICPHLSKTTVERALNRLVEEGTITRYGSGRSTYYVRNK